MLWIIKTIQCQPSLNRPSPDRLVIARWKLRSRDIQSPLLHSLFQKRPYTRSNLSGLLSPFERPIFLHKVTQSLDPHICIDLTPPHVEQIHLVEMVDANDDVNSKVATI